MARSDDKRRTRLNVIAHLLSRVPYRDVTRAEKRVTLNLAPEFAPRVRRHEPLSRHTSWHVGGPAELFFNPRDRADLAAFLRALPPAVPRQR